MKKNLLIERFQKLAGIKPLYEAPAKYDDGESKEMSADEAPKKDYHNAQLNADAELHHLIYKMMERAFLNAERGKPADAVEKVWDQVIKYKRAYQYLKPIDSKLKKFYDELQKKYHKYWRPER